MTCQNCLALEKRAHREWLRAESFDDEAQWQEDVRLIEGDVHALAKHEAIVRTATRREMLRYKISEVPGMTCFALLTSNGWIKTFICVDLDGMRLSQTGLNRFPDTLSFVRKTLAQMQPSQIHSIFP